VRDAVRALLVDRRYRERARALQAEHARYDALARGVDLLERLIATGRSVLRSDLAPRPATADFASALKR
jgi:hypothetical protein